MTAQPITWQNLIDEYTPRFGGQHPGRTLEAELVQHFTHRPNAVLAALDKTATRYAAGKITSPWPIVLLELQHDAKRADIVAKAKTPEQPCDFCGVLTSKHQHAACCIHAPLEIERLADLARQDEPPTLTDDDAPDWLSDGDPTAEEIEWR
jgi:hypothetical protein